MSAETSFNKAVSKCKKKKEKNREERKHKQRKKGRFSYHSFISLLCFVDWHEKMPHSPGSNQNTSEQLSMSRHELLKLICY